MRNKDLREEFRIANVRQWEIAEAMGISEMTFLKWLRRELPEEKKKLVRQAMSVNIVRNVSASLVWMFICSAMLRSFVSFFIVRGKL